LKPGKAFAQGLISDLGNPKMAVFFASLLPQFATPGDGLFAALMTLGLVFSLMTFLWLTAYAFVIAKAGEVLRRLRIRRWIETGDRHVAGGARPPDCRRTALTGPALTIVRKFLDAAFCILESRAGLPKCALSTRECGLVFG